MFVDNFCLKNQKINQGPLKKHYLLCRPGICSHDLSRKGRRDDQPQSFQSGKVDDHDDDDNGDGDDVDDGDGDLIDLYFELCGTNMLHKKQIIHTIYNEVTASGKRGSSNVNNMFCALEC